jgi:hypothetical protein
VNGPYPGRVNALEHIIGPVILVSLLGLAMRQQRKLNKAVREDSDERD